MSTNRSLFVAAMLGLGAFGVVSSAGCGSSGGPAKGTAVSGGNSGSGGNGSGGNGSGSGGNGSGSGGNSSGSGGNGSGGNGSGSGGNGSGSGGNSSGSGGNGNGSGGNGSGSGSGFAINFDSGLQGMMFNTYQGTGATDPKNLAVSEAGAPPTIMFESGDGNPSNGSAKLALSFTDYRQAVDAVIGFDTKMPLNLSGKTLHVKVKLVSGTFVGGATVHVSTITPADMYKYKGGTWTQLSDHEWKEMTLDLSALSGTDGDPSMIDQIGIQFNTGDPPEAGAFAGPADCVFLIDSYTDGASTSSGSGGLSGSDGGTSAGSGGSTAAVGSYTFDTSSQAFALNNYDDKNRKNLGGPNAGSTPMLSFDSSAGEPSSGSLKVQVTFTDYKQYVDAAINLNPTINLMGKKVHAKVRLDSGAFTGGAILHVATTSTYVEGASAWTSLTMGTWADLMVDLSTITTSGFDAAMAIQLGVRLDTGDAPEAGTFSGPAELVLHIDSITAD